MYIDCHTHCRDEAAKQKGETIKHALRVAEDSGLSGIFDMPNIPDPVTSRKRVFERFALAQEADSDVFFGVYVGITPDLEQVREAVECHKEFFPKPEDRRGVIGLKMFAGKSVGDLTVSDPEDQFRVYRKLAELGYMGVLAVHCEKESLMVDYFDSENPTTHCFARPIIAEEFSIADQIKFARDSNYHGHLHIVHASSAGSVGQVKKAKETGLKISCGVTPHHLLLDDMMMRTPKGILFKMNPPLRSSDIRDSLFSCFLTGEIDILESDHAPHSPEDKTERYMSGIPNLASWPDFLELLRQRGVSQERLDETAYSHVNEIFGTRIRRLYLPVKRGAHLDEYFFDPYSSLKT